MGKKRKCYKCGEEIQGDPETRPTRHGGYNYYCRDCAPGIYYDVRQISLLVGNIIGELTHAQDILNTGHKEDAMSMPEDVFENPNVSDEDKDRFARNIGSAPHTLRARGQWLIDMADDLDRMIEAGEY